MYAHSSFKAMMLPFRVIKMASFEEFPPNKQYSQPPMHLQKQRFEKEFANKN